MSPPQKAAEDPRSEKVDEKDTKDVQPYDRRDEGYFSYYAMLTHQAQMLQVCQERNLVRPDACRTPCVLRRTRWPS